MVRMLQPVTCLLFLLKVSLMFLVSLIVFTIHWNIQEDKCQKINPRKFKQKHIEKRTGNSVQNLRAHQKECKVETGIKRKADTDNVKPLKLARLTPQSTQNCFLSSRRSNVSWYKTFEGIPVDTFYGSQKLNRSIGNKENCRPCSIIKRSNETICRGRWGLGFETPRINMMNQVENELIPNVKEVEVEMERLVQKSFLMCSCVTCDKTRSNIDTSSPSRELLCVNMEPSISNVEASSSNMEASSSNIEASCSAGDLLYSKVETSSPVSDESYVNCDVSFSNVHKFKKRKHKKKFKSSKTKPDKYWKDLFRKKKN